MCQFAHSFIHAMPQHAMMTTLSSIHQYYLIAMPSTDRPTDRHSQPAPPWTSPGLELSHSLSPSSTFAWGSLSLWQTDGPANQSIDHVVPPFSPLRPQHYHYNILFAQREKKGELCLTVSDCMSAFCSPRQLPRE